MCCRCWLPFWCGENIWTLLQQYPWLATSFHRYWNFWVIVTHLTFICDFFSVSAEERKDTLSYRPHIFFSILLKSFVSGEEREEIFCWDKSSGGSCCCFSKESQPVPELKYNFDFDKESQQFHIRKGCKWSKWKFKIFFSRKGGGGLEFHIPILRKKKIKSI